MQDTGFRDNIVSSQVGFGGGAIYIASDTGGQAELLVARSTFRSRPLFPTARIYVPAAFSGP